MAKWIDRLHVNLAAPPSGGTDRTDKRGVLSVLSVSREGGDAEISSPTDERVTCLACGHFLPNSRRCGNHRRAGLRSPWLGLDLPTLPQRCGGFVHITT